MIASWGICAPARLPARPPTRPLAHQSELPSGPSIEELRDPRLEHHVNTAPTCSYRGNLWWWLQGSMRRRSSRRTARRAPGPRHTTWSITAHQSDASTTCAWGRRERGVNGAQDRDDRNLHHLSPDCFVTFENTLIALCEPVHVRVCAIKCTCTCARACACMRPRLGGLEKPTPGAGPVFGRGKHIVFVGG